MKLICPICGTRLQPVSNSLTCKNNHSFDFAKSGYINLLLKQSKGHGDNSAMVQARTSFLSKGYYAFLNECLQEITRKENPEVLVDSGCGEGYYTSQLAGQEKYGFDLSKDALKHAAKNDRFTLYAVSSIFHLPLPDECADFILTCFAPAACEEIQRILKKNGCFVFVTPGPDHLFELKQLLYETPYKNRTEALNLDFKKETEFTISSTFHCEHADLENLFMMTPYAYRTKEKGKELLRQTEALNLTAEFVIRIYRK